MPSSNSITVDRGPPRPRNHRDDAEIEGDALFPPLDGSLFEEVEREPHLQEGGPPFAFVRYVRRAALP
jgi:hypothetical protein